MLITGFNGKQHNWKPRGADFSDSSRSNLHLKIRDLLREIYPFDVIMEEVTLPGSNRFANKKELTADFFLPNRSMIIEAHGEQHYLYNSFFFKNKFEFAKAQRRDLDKKAWCESNNIQIIELKYSDSIDFWRQQIVSRRQEG
jgi:hypothetical protein